MAPRSIGTLRETPLHAALKQHLAQPADQLEVTVDGFVADILRGQQVLEVQTQNFAAFRRKLAHLLERRPVCVIHPIALEKWVVNVNARGTVMSRRKSPQRGTAWEIFAELVSVAELATHPNFSLQVCLVREEEVRVRTRKRRRWGRTHRVAERRLLEVVETIFLAALADYVRFLPDALPEPFTSTELAKALRQPVWLAQKMTYCLRKMGVLSVAGKRRGAWLYARAV
ncbi:MAG: hypothetical protein JNL09_04290 [Anaerolineales bacterium]|nr:hypothetical protein [Anaerolineales bacterium]